MGGLSEKRTESFRYFKEKETLKFRISFQTKKTMKRKISKKMKGILDMESNEEE